jgi:large subunit ribosomal protein L31
MKKDIHPSNYRLVAFKDMSNDEVFITRSTAETKDSLVVDGVEYPLVKWKSLVLLTHSTQVKLN